MSHDCNDWHESGGRDGEGEIGSSKIQTTEGAVKPSSGRLFQNRTSLSCRLVPPCFQGESVEDYSTDSDSYDYAIANWTTRFCPY
jgi:hypothetical protein